MGLKTQYYITSRLFNQLKLAKVDGTYQKELNKLIKNDLLILDDFGLKAFDNHAREALMDIIEDRYNAKSTIVSSQIPVSTWYDIIGEGTIADYPHFSIMRSNLLNDFVNQSHIYI